jgi:hypothetical protein
MLRQRQFTESQVNPMGDPQMDFDFGTEDTSAKINDPKRSGISSKHPGGANVGVADGQTRWAREWVTPGALRALLTIAGGEETSMDQALGEK